MLKLGPIRVIWRGERPVASWREDAVTVVIGLIGVVALYWDAWRHNTTAIESDNFWSSPHIALYAALSALGAWFTVMALRRMRPPEINLAAIPRGYLLGFAGLVLAGVGGPADFLWHEAYGFEDQVNAFWSPPHQLLFYGGTLAAAAPFVSGWSKGSRDLGVRAGLLVVLALAFVCLAGTFTLHHLSPMFAPVAPTDAFQADLAQFDDSYPSGGDRPDQVGLDAALREFDDERFPYYYYSLNQAIGGLLLTSLALTGAILLLVSRWLPPPGAVTLLLTFYSFIYSITGELEDVELVAGFAAAGIVVDLLIARLRPEPRARTVAFRALAAAVPVAILGGYFLAMELLGDGLEWGISVWLGVIITAVAGGLGLSVLAAPPWTVRDAQ